MIHRNLRIKEAASFGVPVTQYDPHCRGSQDYVSLAEEVLKEQTEGVWIGPSLVLKETSDDRSGHAAESDPR